MTDRVTAELSVVVPTLNEHGNVQKLLTVLDQALSDVNWEVIYVDDDSTDGTLERLREMAASDARVRCLHRVGRRGLSTACIEGILASSAPYVAVMDADLQHDENILPAMIQELRGGETEIVVGSRYVTEGGVGSWDKSRARISRIATRLSQVVLRVELCDPMSGFFMLRRDVAISCIKYGVSGIGYKILLDLFASSPRPLKFKELTYQFRERTSGGSKLDSMVAWEYFMLLLDKLVGHLVPVRFLSFLFVGGLGVFVHLFVLALVFKTLNYSFLAGQVSATLVAMTFNFTLNNLLTYRDMRLQGWGLLRGWFSFVLACSIGALANVGVAEYLFEQDAFWISSALAGILVGAVWNYAVTAVYTWRKPKAC